MIIKVKLNFIGLKFGQLSPEELLPTVNPWITSHYHLWGQTRSARARFGPWALRLTGVLYSFRKIRFFFPSPGSP